MTLFDRIILLATGLVAAYLVWRFYTRWSKEKALHDIYYRSFTAWPGWSSFSPDLRQR
jgi:hypothetical protein